MFKLLRSTILALSLCYLAGAEPDLSGNWKGWGGVELHKTAEGYEGTYLDTFGHEPGQIKITPVGKKQPYDFVGTWGEPNMGRSGTFKLNLHENDSVLTVVWTATDNQWKPRGGNDDWTRQPLTRWEPLEIYTLPYGTSSKKQKLALAGLRMGLKQLVKKGPLSGQRLAAALQETGSYKNAKHVWVVYGRLNLRTNAIEETAIEQMSDAEEIDWFDQDLGVFQSKYHGRDNSIKRHATGLAQRKAR